MKQQILFVMNFTWAEPVKSVAFSRDGTKLYTLTILTSGTLKLNFQLFHLPGPFDISSYTEIHQVELVFDLVSQMMTDVTERGRGIEFSSDGSAMFLLVGNTEESDETDRIKKLYLPIQFIKKF